MTFTKQQTIIIFCLGVGLLVLIVVVISQISRGNSNTTISQKEQSIITEVQSEFQNTVDSTESQKELDSIKDLSIFEKSELFPYVNAPELPTPTDVSRDFDPLQNYRFLSDDLYIYNDKISNLGVFVDNPPTVITDQKVNEWADGTIIIRSVDEAEPFLADEPILRNSKQAEYNNSVYLAKDNVFFHLGDNITNVYQFEINSKKYWVSVFEGNTGSNQLYFSGAFFAGMQKIKGVNYQDGQISQNGNFLILDKLVTGTDGVGRAKYRINIKGIAESKVLDDYSKFVTLEE